MATEGPEAADRQHEVNLWFSSSLQGIAQASLALLLLRSSVRGPLLRQAQHKLSDVPGYADKLEAPDRDVLKLRPGITGPATLKYRLEDEMIAEYVAKCKAAGDTRPDQDIAVEYNDTVIYPDKVRLNCYYYRNYSFLKDIEMIFATVLGKKVQYAGEEI